VIRNTTIQWLLDSAEPWTRYRALADLLGRPEEDADVAAARAAMVAHPGVQGLIAQAAAWPGRPIGRHNDASHPIYALSTLADFGLRGDDPGLDRAVAAVLAHQSADGALQSVLNVAPAFGGTGEDTWSWALCDAPTLLYALLALYLTPSPSPAKRGERQAPPSLTGRGGGEVGALAQAVEHLAALSDEVGWRCRCGPELGKFRGPGRRADPCPIANVYALKALSLVPEHLDSLATRQGAEMLLSHWERRAEVKFYLFGIGSDFRKLKYPFVWYDLLHVADVLSRFPFLHADARLREMIAAITAQADAQGRYTAGSMYQAWKGWSFADKKQPSPWLTFLALRLQARIAAHG
jgi:hypothetical protein